MKVESVVQMIGAVIIYFPTSVPVEHYVPFSILAFQVSCHKTPNSNNDK